MTPSPSLTRLRSSIGLLTVLSLLVVLAGAALRTEVAFSGLSGLYWGLSGAVLLGSLALALNAWIKQASLRWLFTAAAAVAIVEISLGTVSLLGIATHPLIGAVHLAAAMLLGGVYVWISAILYLPLEPVQLPGLSSADHRFYTRSLFLTGLGLLLLLSTGAIVTGTNAGPACPDWPLCQGEIFPLEFSLEIVLNLLHRFSVVAIGALAAAVILQTRRLYSSYPRLNRWAMGLGWLFVLQVALGSLYAFTAWPPELIRGMHLAVTIAIWGSLVVLGAIAYVTLDRGQPETQTSITPEPQQWRQKALTFFKLTKPWILVLLLITTLTAMVIAARGLPSLSLMLYTLLGGLLSAGGASVLNSYIDSDIDGVMSRTSRRATVTGLVTPQETLLFGLLLSVASFLLFAIFVNLLSAILSTLGIIYYVFFYTLYLKRTTIHNIIIGGAAGAIPPLVGWTAVTNALDLSAFYLFAIIFFWTPPHTWALALLVKGDYAKARVPMLPVVVGEQETTYQIFLYSILLITLTLLPVTFNMVSWAYMLVALILGARFLYLAWKLWRNYNKSISKKLYKFSQAYLALLFLAMALDRSFF